jgi:hypothetical protein
VPGRCATPPTRSACGAGARCSASSCPRRRAGSRPGRSSPFARAAGAAGSAWCSRSRTRSRSRSMTTSPGRRAEPRAAAGPGGPGGGRAALSGAVKDRLRTSALSLSGGQQAAAVHRPGAGARARRAAARRARLRLGPDRHRGDRGTRPHAQAPLHDRHRHHNMQQAARVADRTAFFSLDTIDGVRSGTLIEYGADRADLLPPTGPANPAYISGEFG